jgi:hypothetical protein
MTNELWAALIGAVVILLTNLAGLVKVWSEMTKTKADRAQTKEYRDASDREIRDMILKHDFAICQLKDSQALTATVVDDLRDTCAALNTSVAKLDLNIANLAEAVKELKK